MRELTDNEIRVKYAAVITDLRNNSWKELPVSEQDAINTVREWIKKGSI